VDPDPHRAGGSSLDLLGTGALAPDVDGAFDFAAVFIDENHIAADLAPCNGILECLVGVNGVACRRWLFFRVAHEPSVPSQANPLIRSPRLYRPSSPAYLRAPRPSPCPGSPPSCFAGRAFGVEKTGRLRSVRLVRLNRPR
jgi:hypothetical protein